MKLTIALAAALLVTAGPAAAQMGFNDGQRQKGPFGFGGRGASSAAKPPSSYLPNSPYLPNAQPPASRPRSPGFADAPAAPALKPYEPYKPYRPATTYGGKPCETSVFVNACDR